MIPIHFLSVEHLKLQEKHGRAKGTKIGDIYVLVSGWVFFIFWMNIWISPQPRFAIPFLGDFRYFVLIDYFSTSLVHLLVGMPFLLLGTWLAIKAVKETSLKTAETHRTEKIITTGAYSIVRYSQYLGGLLAHTGIAFLLSTWYSLIVTPLMVALVYLISRKEEELIKEFGREYEEYKEKAPMLIPRL